MTRREDFSKLRLRTPERPLGTFAKGIGRKKAVEGATLEESVREAEVPAGVGDARGNETPPADACLPAVISQGALVVVGQRLPAPYLSRAAALHEECARVDPLQRIARVSPFGDEACAALFGLERWCEYLRRSGSGIYAAPGGVGADGALRREGLVFDLAPQVPSVRYDLGRGSLVRHHPVERPPPAARLVEAMLGLTGGAGFDGEALLSAARPELDPGLRLWGRNASAIEGQARREAGEGQEGPEASARGEEGQARPRLAWSLAANGPGDIGSGFDPVAAVLRLGVAADLADRVTVPLPGVAVPEGELGAELLARMLETLMVLRSSANACDAGIRDFPYYGIVEGKALRCMTFAGAAMSALAILMEARVAGAVVPTSWEQLMAATSVRDLGPRVDRGRSEGASLEEGARGEDLKGHEQDSRGFDDAWFEAAFAGVQRFVPCVPVTNDVRAGAPYRAADLAEGLEHARAFAYASVAIAVEAHGVEGDRADRRAAAEMAFWRDGVVIDGPLGPSARGLAPLVFRADAPFDWRQLEHIPIISHRTLQRRDRRCIPRV